MTHLFRQRRTLDIYHTHTDPNLRGNGLAEIACKAAFRHATERGLRVVPSCSYVSGHFVPRHPELAPMTVGFQPAFRIVDNTDEITSYVFFLL